MEMTRIEKRLMNRPAKAGKKIARAREQLSRIETGCIGEVLELGCGTGDVSSHLARTYGWRVCGTDYDPAQPPLARQRNGSLPNLLYRREDAARLSFEDGSVNLDVSQNVFHHIADWPAAREVARVLRPGGYPLWYDLTSPPVLKRILRPLAPAYGLYCYSDLFAVFRAIGFTLRDEMKSGMGAFAHYQLVLERS